MASSNATIDQGCTLAVVDVLVVPLEVRVPQAAVIAAVPETVEGWRRLVAGRGLSEMGKFESCEERARAYVGEDEYVDVGDELDEGDAG